MNENTLDLEQFIDENEVFIDKRMLPVKCKRIDSARFINNKQIALKTKLKDDIVFNPTHRNTYQ